MLPQQTKYLVMSLKDNKAVGHDKIPAFFLKIGRYVITPNFQLFLQFSFKHGMFPNNCKIARVSPKW